MSPSKTLFYLCISLVIGIGLNSLIKIPQTFVWGIFILGILIIAISFLLNKNKMIIFGFCLLILLLGVVRFQISQFNIDNNELKNFNDQPEKITLIGFVSADPDVRDNLQKLRITTKKGDVLITIGPYENYHYLDEVKVTGKLKAPAVFDDFNYKDYLEKDGIYSLMSYPKIELISIHHQYNIITYVYEKILFLKSKLLAGIDASLSPPHSFILQGMVFGNDKNMSDGLKNEFNVTGLSHVTAVSGTNIVIIINMMIVFLLALGFWRGQAFYLAVIFIWIYIVLIGFPSSGVRAAIMGCIALLAQKLGRQNESPRVLVLAGTLMLFQNPLLLARDVGFQLSFLASLGIMYIKPLLDIALNKITNEHGKFFTDLMAITFAAQIITLPIIIYNFGQLSLVAPLSNLLALPPVEALTVLGFLLSIIGAIFPFVSFIFAIPCWFLLTYFMAILDFFAKPWATINITYFPWFFVVFYYVILFAIIKFSQKFQRPKFLGY